MPFTINRLSMQSVQDTRQCAEWSGTGSMDRANNIYIKPASIIQYLPSYCYYCSITLSSPLFILYTQMNGALLLNIIRSHCRCRLRLSLSCHWPTIAGTSRYFRCSSCRLWLMVLLHCCCSWCVAGGCCCCAKQYSSVDSENLAIMG